MVGLKLLFAAAVLAAAWIGGGVPLRQHAARANERVLGWGNAFAAGVFLGAGLIHMLPDAHRSWEALGFHYPVAFALASAAFVLLLLFEHLLLPDAAHQVVHAPSSDRFSLLDRPVRVGVGVYAVLAALSIHSLVAGLALGAQSERARAYVILLAILAHKGTAAFALGVSLVRSHMPPARAWGLLAFFSAATPVGILAGAFGEQALEGRMQVVLSAGLLSLAAGTFTYVATLDILRDEFHEAAGRGAKWAMVALGSASMALLAIWV